MGPTGQKSCQFFINSRLVFSAKNFEKCGGFLFHKCKVVVFGKFGIKSGGFMLLTPDGAMGAVCNVVTGRSSHVFPHLHRRR
jgi:hypothetical protein